MPLPSVIEIKSLFAIKKSKTFCLIINRMRMNDIHHHRNSESMCLINQSLELLRSTETRTQSKEVCHLIAERSVVRMFLKRHDLQGIISQVRNLRQDIQTELLKRSDLLLLSRHSDMAFIDKRMRTSARLAMLPLVWDRIPHLCTECLCMRILHSSGNICRNSLTTTARPLDIKLVQRTMIEEH